MTPATRPCAASSPWLLAFVLAACGTKGALYLPPPEGEDAAAAKKK